MASSEAFVRASRLTTGGLFIGLLVDGMDLQMLAVALPSIARDFKLSSVMAGALSTYTLIGMGIGGVIAGWLSDRWGRVRVVWWSIVLFTICTALIAFCKEYWQIAAMRLASGFGISGLYSVGTLMAAECVPTRQRTTVLGVLQAGWSVGYVVAALLAAYLLPAFGWRALFFCAVFPGLAALLALWNTTDPPAVLSVQNPDAPSRATFRQMWADPAARRLLLMWTITTVALQFGYYGANTWLPSYLVTDLGVDLKSMGWYVAATYAMMVVGKVVTGYLADIYGRRVLWIVPCLMTAVYLPVATSLATAANVPYILLVFGLLYGAPYAVAATYMSESFTASIRGTAVGTAYNLGRIGAALSPLLIGTAASHYSIGAGIGLLGVAYAVCGLVPALWIKEHLFDPQATETPAAVPRQAIRLVSR